MGTRKSTKSYSRGIEINPNCSITFEELAVAVRSMRYMHRRAYKYGLDHIEKRAKEEEKRVDDMIYRIFDTQPPLFFEE